MTPFSLRSLLLAAIVLSNCITWTASRHHYTHNVLGHRSRHRRQGAGLYLPASYVIPGGEGTGWGEWGETSPCSRTCGGGVASQKRICLELGSDGQPRCTGGDTKYFSCQTQDCPAGSPDFRAQQCSEFDDVAIRNIKYKWVPYTKAPNPCELNCMPHAERFYYRHKMKVVDGTRCNDESFDVCVNGTCQPVGCDMMLGSSAREDKCRECRGNGANCHTANGVLDDKEIRTGYTDLLVIPEGATNIVIAERAPSNNYLALRPETGPYYLNGDYHVEFPRSLMIAGALWTYERSQQGFEAPDKLRCLGPTNERLYVAILLQSENVGIEYEYSIPKDQAPTTNKQYNWVHEEFTPCTASCGGGYQTRNVTCRSREELELVDESLCEQEIKPPTNQTCNNTPCTAQWTPEPWGKCSKRCGEGGIRKRNVTCTQIIINGYPSIVADDNCFKLYGAIPLFEKCNENATCPLWFTGPWKPCDKLCDEGKQTRKVVCYQKNGKRIEVLPDDECVDEKPEAEQKCLLQLCKGVDWLLSDWSKCDTCLSKEQTRSAVCATEDNTPVNETFCAYHPTPVTRRECDKTKLPPCEVQWYATQWSKCSVVCGKGVQNRKVFCGMFDGASVLKVDDERCAALPKYNDTKECEVPKEKCPAQWFTEPWGPCKTTGRDRGVLCLQGGKKVDESACNLDDYPETNMSCDNKDELLTVDGSSLESDDGFEDCDEEDYPEAGVEVVGSPTPDDFHSTMFSDSPEGSGDSTIWSSTVAENESTFPETGSTLTSEEFFTTDTGSGMSETDLTGITDDSTDTTFTDLSSSTSGYDTSSNSGSTTESDAGATLTTVSGETEGTDATYTTENKATDESTTAGETSETTETATTGTVDESGGSTTESALSSTESTESGPTVTGDTSETSESNSNPVSTTESGTTDTELTITTNADTSETSESSSSVTTDATEPTTIGSTETTDSSSSSETTEATSETTEATSETTEDTSGTTEAASETTEDTSGTTEVSSETTEATSITTEASSETTEDTSGTTESTSETTEGSSGTTESSNTTDSDTSTTDSESAGTTETTDIVSTDATTEKDSTETTDGVSTTESTGTTEITESSEPSTTAETGSTEQSETVTTETTESVSTESATTDSTATSETGSTETTESTSVGSTDSTITEETSPSGSTETTEEGSTVSTSETESTSESSTESTTEGITRWDLTSTVEVYTTSRKRVCRRRPCERSQFGCCPDKKTPAHGPFDLDCPKPHTCLNSTHGCCPDGVSPAKGPLFKGCPVEPCAETLFGCCNSDNKTAAEGNDQEGCPPPPPPCVSSKYGCCKDGEAEATGPEKAGCPETTTTVTDSTEEETESTSMSSLSTGVTEPATCAETQYGCCYDNETASPGPDNQGCPCSVSEFGCCPDEVSPAQGPQFEGCVKSCNTSAYGCCSDGKTPAHGPDGKGCCLLTSFGCCPDNYKSADGPHFEGCGCQYAKFGCCPDKVTAAAGADNAGCGCQYTQHGCCPDRHTAASGPDYEGCKCHTYQFGCCPDGVTTAQGPNGQGCYCQQTNYGCCGDEQTHAKGPNKEGCDCSTSKYGCCPDGSSEATGPKFQGCTDKPDNKQAACKLKFERGPCRNYSVNWFYDTEYGGCSRFWYGGCEGNGNRFSSKEDCEDTCVSPPPKDACKLPQIKGACLGYNLRWYYDNEREACSNFVYGGCLGNDNNFENLELCQKQCEPERAIDQCNLPIESGSCAGNYPRWGYNHEQKRCEQFVWGGCEGNTNRFSTEAACMLRCNPPGEQQPECAEQQDVGNCTETEALWSFSQSENRCVPFYYTGCGGNENKFRSQEECQESCPSVFVPELCTLPAATGDCADYRTKWYFDTKDQRCRQFYYGGCGGNGNKFDTEQQCSQRCSAPATTPAPAPTPAVTEVEQRPDEAPSRYEVCFMEIDAGPCTQFETVWGYDYKLGRCTSFQYGGCGGNQNHFTSEELCSYYCQSTQDICQLPMLAGPCDDSVMQWFYDASTDSCSQFTYGGCNGNENRFNSVEDCENKCKTGTAVSATTLSTTTTPKVINRFAEDLPAECRVSSLEPCSRDTRGEVWFLSPDTGECTAHENLETGNQCRNTGTFYSQEACERACGAFRNIDVCLYPVDSGPCRAFIPKYHFNATSRRCEEFAYGGCLGGANRFSSEQECEQICMTAVDPCTLPPEQGNCIQHNVMWYYDRRRDSCYQFAYGGCGGNDNKFDSREQCEGRCRQRAADVTTTTPAPVQPQPDQDQCRTPTSLEPCGANITVYYFDKSTSTCAQAGIGNCRYANSYRSEEECERQCGAFRGINVCQYPLDPGPCRSPEPKFYFDAASGSCKSYAYGGCQGGPNRFSTSEECEEICSASGPDVEEESRICSRYAEECLSLNSTCVYGVRTDIAPEGCERCACEEPANCEQQRRECDAMRCDYGLERTTGGDGCETCKCFDDPCLRSNCASDEHCVASAYRDPATQAVVYSAHCVPENETNEIPDCEAYIEECSRISCPYGIQRTRTGGCERCSCVREEVDCATLESDCGRLKCSYGLTRTRGEDGCFRCKCLNHPCDEKECPAGKRCVTTTFRDPVTQEPRYSADCGTVNKPGQCPEAAPLSGNTAAPRECRDDADCRGELKCCDNVCKEAAVSAPDVPRAPEPSSETEPQVAVAEGGKATLRCIFHGNPPPRVTWRFGEITIDSDVDRYRLLSDGALEIVSLFRNDSGVYICIGTNDLGTSQQQITLEVTDPVEVPAGIAETDRSVVGELGQPVSVKCLAYGYPAPNIFWYRGAGGPLVPFSSAAYEARGGELLIRRLGLDTLGEYECQAFNGQGRPATARYRVQAYAQGDGSDPRSEYVIARERVVQVTPRAPFTDSTPAPAVEIPSYTESVRVHLLPANTSLSAGSQLSLPCEVYGFPEPKVHWTKDGVILAPTDRMWITDYRLTIPQTQPSDSGEYGCHAANEYTSQSDLVRVNVQEINIPHTCKDNPLFANCKLIVESRFCLHRYYSRFCCKSCVESGQLNPHDVEMQGDEPFRKK